VGEPGALTPLLQRLDAELAAEGLARQRLLYLYPSEVHDPLVATMLDTPTVVPYFDLSLQHADRALLARMKRWGSGERFLRMMGDVRAREPEAVFRSSFIVGFPGETEAAHDALLGFLDAAELEWAGFFPFSREEGTAAADLDGAVPAALVAERLRECADVQTPITEAARDELVRAGAEIDVVVDGVDDDTGDLCGRTHREAPEIDGVVRLGRATPGETELATSTNGGGVVRLEGAHARRGSRVRAKVTAAQGIDLVAAPIEVLT
jgi:ribosomal protein S12 methylthiotransferase